MPENSRTIDPNAMTARELAVLVNTAAPGTIDAIQITHQIRASRWPLGSGKRLHLVMYLGWLRSLLAAGGPLKPAAAPKSAEFSSLSAGALADLVNTALPGTVQRHQINYQLRTATRRLGSGNRIDLTMYAAWLRALIAEDDYLKRPSDLSHADEMRERRARERDIGPVPDVQNPPRRAACIHNLRLFLETYLRATFPQEFSAGQLQIIIKIQRAALKGGLFADAAPRGGGKTTIAEGASVWAILNGHRRYIPVIAATAELAYKIMKSIQSEFENNALLLADFPEACFPIHELEGIYHRAPGQTCGGRPTHIQWRTSSLVLPTIEGSPSSASIIHGFGLTGSLRGLRHKLPTGEVIRPDFVILDDPQTDKSARSPAQCDSRERLIMATILGLGSVTKPLGVVCPCTVIQKDDLADRLLDHKRHPEWQGVRIKMVESWSDHHEKLWLGRYAELRRADLPESAGGRPEAERQATEFYSLRRRRMDAGCKIFRSGWYYPPGELSGIQHVYNILIDYGEAVFRAEYQNDPIDEFVSTAPPLAAADVLAKIGGHDRYQCPHGSSLVSAFVDVGSQTHVHHMLCAWGDGFSGAVIDYGVRQVKPAVPTRAGREAAVVAALEQTLISIFGRSYPLEGGGELNVGIVLVDSGWLARLIYALIRRLKLGNVHPSKGQGGERDLYWPRSTPRRNRGDGWYHAWNRERDAYLVTYDVDKWKSFAEARLRTPHGGRGCLTLWRAAPRAHITLAEHFTSERPKPQHKPSGDVFDKYKLIVGRPNHLWDSLVGCCVGGAHEGVRLDEDELPRRPARGREGPARTLNEMLAGGSAKK